MCPVKRSQKSRFNGPLPGCPIKDKHSSEKCKNCRTVRMRNARASGAAPYQYSARTKAVATLGVYVRRGKVQRLPCAVCGEVKVRAHHADYAKPLDVVWLCRRHLNELHPAPDISR
jgi:hypothetical protein